MLLQKIVKDRKSSFLHQQYPTAWQRQAERGGYLSVGDDRDPKGLGGPWHGQHAPQEDHEGEWQGEEGAVHHLVQDHQEVAEQLGVGDQHVDDGNYQTVGAGLALLKLSLLVLGAGLQLHQADREKGDV